MPNISGSAVDYGGGQSAFGSILGAVPFVGGILNGVSQIFTNARNRKFQEHMYDKQRNDALSDWNMQNDYNSPQNQMARLKAAGLNPNLVYGSGAVATSSAPPRASNYGSSNAQAPRLETSGLLQSFMVMLKAEMQDQVIENLKTQNLVLQSQVGKNVAQTGNIEVDTELKKFNLQMSNVTRDLDIALKTKSLAHIDISNNVMLDANERAAAMTTANLAVAAQRVLQLRLDNEMNPLKRQLIQAQISNIQASTTLRNQTIELQRNGFTWSDPYYIRAGLSLINKLTDIGTPGSVVGGDLSPTIGADRSLDDMWREYHNKK